MTVAGVVILCVIAWIGVTLGIAVRRAGRAAMYGRRTQPRTDPRGAFPVVPLLRAALTQPVEKVRRYRVVGVNAMNTGDVAYTVEAATPANAKVKAELAGVIVTEVVEEPE